MQNKKLLTVLGLFVFGGVLMLLPVPQGLTPQAWKMFAIFVTAILGLILRPYSEPVIMFSAIAVSAIMLNNLNAILRGGFGTGTPWLIFSAFSLSVAFAKTNLGRRIAYLLMYKLGQSTLGIGYVTAFVEVILAPVTPANSARAGGIVFPILNSVCAALGSEPNSPSARKAGHYFTLNLWNCTKTSSYIFMTAMGANVVAVAVCKEVLGIDVDWTKWFLAASVPGFLLLLFIPLIIYLMYPPELKKIDGRTIAEAGLKELGPMSQKEKLLTVVFILALLGWIFGKSFKINETAVGIAAMSALLLVGVIEWKDILGAGAAWTTVSWFGGIIGLSAALAQTGFFKWLAKTLGELIPQGIPPFTSLAIVIFLSVIVRYFFASGSAYVAAMMPVFLAVGAASGAPAAGLLYLLLFSNSYGGMVTHYGGAAGPILFGAGYNDVKSWWIVGLVLALLSYAVHMTIGVAWLKMLGLY